MQKTWQKGLLQLCFWAFVVGNSFQLHVAEAGLARLSVLGTHPFFANNRLSQSQVHTNLVNGSLWYDDSYNIFYNPALVNDYKNKIMIESTVEGGFFYNLSDYFTIGMYFNRGGFKPHAAESAYAPGIIAPGQNSREFLLSPGWNKLRDVDTFFPIDVFITGDYGIKWGVRFTSAHNWSGANFENHYYHVDTGMYLLGLETFLGATFLSKYEAQNLNLQPNSGVQELEELNAGVKIRYEAWSPYFAYHKYRESGTPMSSKIMGQVLMDNFAVGTGFEIALREDIKLLNHIGFVWGFTDDDLANSEYEKNFSTLILPLTISIEAKATEWLTLRGGVTQEALNRVAFYIPNTGDKEEYRPGPPSVRVGATARYSDLSLDLGAGNYKTPHGDMEGFVLLTASYQLFGSAQLK